MPAGVSGAGQLAWQTWRQKARTCYVSAMRHFGPTPRTIRVCGDAVAPEIITGGYQGYQDLVAAPLFAAFPRRHRLCLLALAGVAAVPAAA